MTKTREDTADIRRGDVLWIQCNPSIGVEPRKVRRCVVVSNDIANRYGQALTVVPTQAYTRQRAARAYMVDLRNPRSTLEDARVANASMVMTYDRGRMVKRAGRLSADAQHALDEALKVHLGLTPVMPGWIRRADHLLQHGREWTPDQSAVGQCAVGRIRNGCWVSGAGCWSDGLGKVSTRHPKPDTCLFRSSGDMWTITFGGTTVQLRDTRGLLYLARLLTQPTHELHATALIGLADVVVGVPIGGDAQVSRVQGPELQGAGSRFAFQAPPISD